MSVNIDHPNEDISTSAGSPPSLGSQAPLVANNATVTANSDGNVARWVMESTSATNTYWAKIATFVNSSGSTNLISIRLLLNVAYGSTTTDGGSTEIDVSIRDDSASGLSSSNSSIRVVNTNNILTDTGFIIVGSASVGGNIELWMQYSATTGRKVGIDVLSRTALNDASWTITYNNGATWQASAPTGAVTITSDWAKPTSVAWTPVVYGATTAGTGTYTTQIGYYWEKDGFIEFIMRVIWTAHTGTGNLEISGLPKSSASGSYGSLSVGVSTISASYPTAYIISGENFIRVQDGTAAETISASGTLVISGRYAV